MAHARTARATLSAHEETERPWSENRTDRFNGLQEAPTPGDKPALVEEKGKNGKKGSGAKAGSSIPRLMAMANDYLEATHRFTLSACICMGRRYAPVGGGQTGRMSHLKVMLLKCTSFGRPHQ